MTEYGPKKRGSRIPKYSRLIAGFGRKFHILFLPPCWHKETRRFAFGTTPKIILVEEEEGEQGQLLSCLENCGIGVEVTLLKSGTDAFQFLEKNAALGEPFLLIVDANAPRDRSFGLVEKVRARESLSGIAISIVGATASEDHLAQAIDLKVVSYVVKPTTDDQNIKLAKVFKELFSSLIEPAALSETLT